MVIADKPQTIMSARMLWLDWVRVLAMVIIFLFHSSRPFVIFPSWHIMNPTPDLGFTLFDTFVSGWIMPLFFAISGIAVYSSLAKRSASQYVRDRFMRLMISSGVVDGYINSSRQKRLNLRKKSTFIGSLLKENLKNK